MKIIGVSICAWACMRVALRHVINQRHKKENMMFKKIRIGLWLLLLFATLLQTWDEYQALQWKKPLHVVVYPINADGSSVTAQYLDTLRESDFDEVEDFFAQQGKRYKLGLRRPIEVRLGPRVHAVPPSPPAVESNWFEIVYWSLKFRMFSLLNQPDAAMSADIKLYLLYYDVNRHAELIHSTALKKGRIGRVNLFALESQHKANMVVMAHELLHTVNATDKYNIHNGMPVFPQGFAEPEVYPLYPQSRAEIMAVAIPLSEHTSRMAPSLERVVVGLYTASEIGWIK